MYPRMRVLQSVRVKSPRPASPRAVHAVIYPSTFRRGAATCSRGDRRMPLSAGLTRSLSLSLSFSPTTMRDSRNTGIRSQTCERASPGFPPFLDARVTMHPMHPMHKPPSEVSLPLLRPSALRPPLCPFAVLTPARIRTVGGCYTVIYIHTSTLYIASHADDCVAFVYVRLAGSRLGWRCPGRVQAGWYMHITTSRAG
jgi:hypothetical protein